MAEMANMRKRKTVQTTYCGPLMPLTCYWIITCTILRCKRFHCPDHMYQRVNQRSLPFRRQTWRSARSSLESKWTIPTATTFAPLVSAFDDGVCRVYRARASGGAGNELSHYSHSFGYRIGSPSPLGPCQYILFSMLRPSMKVDAHFCGASRQKSSPVRKGHISFLSCRYDPSNGEPRFQTLALTRPNANG
jgi:hypothetical protein